MKKIGILSLLVSLAAGCSVHSSNSDAPLHSSDLSTNLLNASFSAQSGDSNVKVFASLFAKDAKGDQKGVELDPNDTFTATVAGGAPVTLTAEAPDGSNVTYTATLPLATDAEDITIALVRGNGQVSAPSSVIHLPAAFTMTSPATTGTLKFGAPVDVKVTPAPTTPLRFEAFGDCVSKDGNDSLTAPTFDADGNGTFDTNQIKLDRASTCQLDLYLDELGDGTLDPAYGGAFGAGVESEQRRDIRVTMTP